MTTTPLAPHARMLLGLLLALVTPAAAVRAIEMPSFREPQDLQTCYATLLLKGPPWTAQRTPDTEKIQRGRAAARRRVELTHYQPVK